MATSATWSIVGQVTPMAVTIFLTPYILHNLGVVRYGLFVLTSSLVSFLSTFDGGVKATAQRYFAVYAGEGDERRSTRLLVTLLLLLVGVGIVVSTTGWFIAPPLGSLLGIHGEVRSQSVILLRTLGVLVTFSFIHNLFVGLLQAHGRFPYIIKAGFAVYALWTVGLIMTVHFNWGLTGIAGVFVAQQIFLIIVIMPESLTYTRRSDVGLLSGQEMRAFLRFGGRVQISSLSGLINTEFDTLLIGAALSVRSVSFYNAGSNIGQNAGAVPFTVLGPLQTSMAQTLGRDGRDGLIAAFGPLQRRWVVIISGWFTVIGAAAYFVIVSWLGSTFRPGGYVAVVAIGTQFLILLTGALRTYCSVIGEPGLESRYGVISVVANVVLTIPLLLLGPVGVAAATCAGQVVGVGYLVHAAQRQLSDNLPSPVKVIPLLACAVAGSSVVGLELLISPYTPGGGLGLIVRGLPALVGLVVYAAVVVSPRPLGRLAVESISEMRARGLRSAARLVVDRAMVS